MIDFCFFCSLFAIVRKIEKAELVENAFLGKA